MNKKIMLIPLVLMSLLVSGCSSNNVDTKQYNLNGVFKDLAITYNEGEVTFDLLSKEYREYNVYKSSSRSGQYEKESVIKKTYTTSDLESYYVFKPVVKGKEVEGYKTSPYSYIRSTFGNDDVSVFTSNDSKELIQEEINFNYNQLHWDEFSDLRKAYLFMPGTYDVTAKIGFYTTCNGLGYSPNDVSIKGFRVDENPIAGNCLINFWRASENFTVEEDALWAVSQATSLRRMNFKGTLSLDNGGYSSGGFLADSHVTGAVINHTQQQWFTRNTSLLSFNKSDINMVFSGVEGSIPNNWPTQRVTVLEKTTKMQEKPFVVYDEVKGYGVFVPDYNENYKGNTWEKDNSGEFISLNKFYVAGRYDTSATLQTALNEGKSILFTPGFYDLDEELVVTKEDTIILGMGLATLRTTDKNKKGCIHVNDVDGVKIGGLLFDAGTYSDHLVEIGDKDSVRNHEANPIVLSDIFIRMGGYMAKTTGADQSVIINSSNVIGDNFWLWRADHGVDRDRLLEYMNDDGTLRSDYKGIWKSVGVNWKGKQNSNYGKNGLVVNGDDVTIYGLMVEHFGEYQTIWNGEDGFMAFYQSETPYDVTNQDEWITSNDETEVSHQGFASYKVGDQVQNHTAYGIGVYAVINNLGEDGNPIILDHAIEAPINPGINLNHMAIANFKSPDGSGIRHICNQFGEGNIRPYKNQKTSLTSFIGGNVNA